MKSKMLLVSVCIMLGLIFAVSHTTMADVQVYDDNDQYIGILVYMDEGWIDMFIPSLGATFRYSNDYSGWCGDELDIVFESTDCSGTPYSTSPFPMIFDFSACLLTGVYKSTHSGKKTFMPGSYWDWDYVCQQTPNYPSAEYYPFVQVQLPFTTPLALPLRLEVKNRAVVIPLN